MRPVWLCPLVARHRAGSLAALPAATPDDLRQRRLLGHRARRAGRPRRAAQPRDRGQGAELGGHKSLYSDAYYDRETFDRLYDGAHLAAVKKPLRPR